MGRAEEALRYARGTWSGEKGSNRDAAAERWSEFSVAYEECFPIVRRYTLVRVADQAAAEDLVAETFERALRGWHSFQHRSAARTWLLGIARHVIADYHRSAGKETAGLQQMAGEKTRLDVPSAEEIVQRRDELDALRQVVDRLGEAERDLLALRYVAELPFREIGAVLGVQEVTVRVRLHRVLARLRAELGEGEE